MSSVFTRQRKDSIYAFRILSRKRSNSSRVGPKTQVTPLKMTIWTTTTATNLCQTFRKRTIITENWLMHPIWNEKERKRMGILAKKPKMMSPTLTTMTFQSTHRQRITKTWPKWSSGSSNGFHEWVINKKVSCAWVKTRKDSLLVAWNRLVRAVILWMFCMLHPKLSSIRHKSPRKNKSFCNWMTRLSKWTNEAISCQKLCRPRELKSSRRSWLKIRRVRAAKINRLTWRESLRNLLRKNLKRYKMNAKQKHQRAKK